jgi:hypothetical protein
MQNALYRAGIVRYVRGFGTRWRNESQLRKKWSSRLLGADNVTLSHAYKGTL